MAGETSKDTQTIFDKTSCKIGSVGQSMVLIMLRLWVLSLWGLFAEELDWMSLVGSFQLQIFCHAMIIPDIVEALFVPRWPWRSRYVTAFLCSTPQSTRAAAKALWRALLRSLQKIHSSAPPFFHFVKNRQPSYLGEEGQKSITLLH